jgi:hypothetical protein
MRRRVCASVSCSHAEQPGASSGEAATEGSTAHQRYATTSDHESTASRSAAGWVQDAVMRVLVDHDGRMRPTQVHAAVEALLGESVRGTR